MKKLVLLTAIFIFSGLVLLSAASSQTADQKTPYKIGAILDITGGASPLGDPEKKTAEMVVAEINAGGGINGHPLELILYDNESDEGKSLIKAKKLIEIDKVLAVFGPSQSGTTLAIEPSFTQAAIPLISCAASWKIIKDPTTNQTRKWIFKTPQSDSLMVERIYTWCKQNGIKKVAIICVSNAYGDSGRRELKYLAPNFKIKIVADESFGAADLDTSAQLTKIKAAKPQAVICWAVHQPSSIVAKNFKQLGMKQTLIMSHGVAAQKFLDLSGDAAEGIVLPAGKLIVADQLPDSDPQKKVLIDYKTKFETKYQTPVSTFGGHAYDAVMILAEALKKAGPDSAKIRDQIEKTKGYVGTAGIFNMSPTDHEGLTKEGVVMVKVKNGKWEMIKD